MCVGTPPRTWHTSPNDTWHTFSSGSASSGFPSRTHMARLSYPDSLKERHTTFTNITSGRPTYTIRVCLSGSLTKVSKSYTLSQQPAMVHVPPPAEWKDKNEVTASHFLRSLPTITYHDFWQSQHLPRSLSAARRVMMAQPPPSVIMTIQNISLPLKRETELLILYIWTFTQGGR